MGKTKAKVLRSSRHRKRPRLEDLYLPDLIKKVSTPGGTIICIQFKSPFFTEQAQVAGFVASEPYMRRGHLSVKVRPLTLAERQIYMRRIRAAVKGPLHFW